MAVTIKYYGKFFISLANKEIDLNSDTIKGALVTSAYTFDQDAHDYFNDITNEVVGTGYTAGGATVANPSIAYDTGTNVFKFDGDDLAWAASTITARGLVIYDSTPASDATRPLIAFVDFGADFISSAGAFNVAFAAAGIATVTVA